MRRYLFLLLPLLIVAFEVDFNKKFSKELPPDILSAYITVTIDDSTEVKVNERLTVFNEKIKSFDKVERALGTFNIRPIYRHASNTPKIDGYKGELRYKFSSIKAVYMNEFVSEVIALKKNRDTAVSVTNLSWKVQDSSYNIALDILRLEALTWIENYAKVLSSDINKKCSIKSVDIQTPIEQVYQERGAHFTIEGLAKKNSIPVPSLSHENFSINPHYKLECK